MALTPTEKQRRYRQRLKEKTAATDRELAPTIFHKPFSDFLQQRNRTGFGDHFDMLGSEWFDFTTDAGIKPNYDDAIDEDEKAAASNSLGKADLIINVMQDVLFTLTQDINDYKRAEIDARIKEVEQSDLSDPATKKQAFADMAKLQKMRDQLDKQVRWTFPQWKVTGE